MGKLLTADCVNRIKYEEKSEFKSSIFAQVYRSAELLTKKIIQMNDSLGQRKDIDIFCNENQISNVISFMGERGMGKSSAMLSYAFFLKEYGKKYADSEEGVPGWEEVRFQVLNKIDAAMMAEGETLFDVVLARLWDTFAERANSFWPQESIVTEVKKKFSEVKTYYGEYWKAAKGPGEGRELSQLEKLHELSQSLNLRKSFATLVEDYLKYMAVDGKKKNYLVLCIDDLDMVTGDIFSKLEQVRQFFTIPGVIVLATADGSRLSLELTGLFSNKLLSPVNVRKEEKKSLRQYADNYIAKVLPRNMRIYMPLFNGMDGEQLELDYEVYLKEVYSTNPGIQINEKMYTSIVLARYMGILFYPNSYLYVKKSLRNMVNTINELEEIVREGGEYEELYCWMQKELNISAQRIEREEGSQLIQRLFQAAREEYNFYTVNWNYKLQKNDSRESEAKDYRPGYGRVLAAIWELEDRWPAETDFFRTLIWLYSAQLSKALKPPQDIERIFIRDDIFSSVVSRIQEMELEGMPLMLNKLELPLKENSSVKKCLMENKEEILKFFRRLMLCDMDKQGLEIEVLQGSREIPEQERSDMEHVAHQTDVPRVRIEVSPVRQSVDYYFRNALDYRGKWNGFVQKIKDKLPREVTESEREEICSALGKLEDFQLYDQWKEKYNSEWIWDILPLQSMDVMLEAVRQWGNLWKMNKDDPNAYIDSMVKQLISMLHEVETHYELGIMGRENLLYAQKLEDLHKAVFGSGFEQLERSFGTAQVEDTSI